MRISELFKTEALPTTRQMLDAMKEEAESDNPHAFDQVDYWDWFMFTNPTVQDIETLKGYIEIALDKAKAPIIDSFAQLKNLIHSWEQLL